MAARAWNDASQNDCSFNYYKEFYLGPNNVVGPPYQIDCRNAVLWRDNNCFKADRGTEYDWLQFFWNLNTVGSDKLSFDDIEAVFDTACGGTCSTGSYEVTVTWPLLRQGALDHYGSIQDPRFLYFEQSGDLFGVDEDQF